MHEAGLARSAVAALLRAAEGRPVRHVSVAVGTGTDLDAVRAAWTSAAAGSILSGAHVTWTVATDELRCLSCDARYAGNRLSVCPRCEGTGLVVAAAPELAIEDWT